LPLFHLGSILLGLLLMAVFTVQVAGEPEPRWEKAAKPRPPRSQVSTARHWPNPPHTVTLFIVNSQEQANALEEEATLGSTTVAAPGLQGIEVERQYLIGDGPDVASQIERTRGLIDYLNLDTEATGPTIILQIVDVRAER
jgi:hypothetical protein